MDGTDLDRGASHRCRSRTMDTTIDQQVAMDEALVPHAQRLRIGRSNFCLLSDIKSKESTLQLEFWATATVHHHAIRFKMDNKKHIINLESFRDMLHICLRVHGQSFAEPPFEEEIIAFICFLGHIEHKNHKKSNEMYYPRFTKAIIYHFMTKDLSIPRRNKFGALLAIELTNEEIRNSNAYKEYYAIVTGDVPPKPKASVRRTRSSSDISITPPTAAAGLRLTTSQKGKQEAKASKAKNKGTGSIPWVPDVPTDEFEDDLSWNSTDDEGDDDQEVVRDDDKDDEKDEEVEGGDDEKEYDEEKYDEETKDEESFYSILHTPENSDDKGNGGEDFGLNVGREEGHDKEEEGDELYIDVNINQGRGIQENLEVEDSHVTLIPVNSDGQQQSSSVSSQFVTSMLNPTLDSDRLRDEAQRENDEFLKTVDENMQKIIKEQDLFEIELKRIFIEKMEGNKSIQRSDEQRNLYKALVEAYESNKIILDTYGKTVTLKRRHDDDVDKDEEPSARPDRGSKRRREGKEPESASAPSETATRSASRSTQGSQSRQMSTSESAFAEEPMQTTCQMKEPLYLEFDTELEYHLEEVFKATADQLDWVNPEGQQYLHNLLKPLPLIPNNRDRHVISFEHFINNDSSIFVEVPQILYKFKEGDFKRLRIQDIEDMLLLLVQGKRRMEDLQLGVESYRKKLNLTKSDSYRSDLKYKEAYTAYSNRRGFIYQNKDKKNRLMRIDELHKFSDGTLTNVCTALNDHLKGIRMQYLPQSIWRKNDKDRAAAMIHAIDKRLKPRRIMRSLERFIGGRLYEGDFRMLKRTI
nr:hypothetical protein [Tanacetum cinerariifolium]